MNNLPFHKNWISFYNDNSLERMSTSVLDKVVRQPFDLATTTAISSKITIRR